MFSDTPWKGEVESSAFHACEDFLEDYKMDILFTWGFWLPNLVGFHGDHKMYQTMKKLAPDRLDGETKCIQMQFINKENVRNFHDPTEFNFGMIHDFNEDDLDDGHPTNMLQNLHGGQQPAIRDVRRDDVNESREIRYDVNMEEEFDRMLEILRQELSLDMNVIEIKKPEKILPTYWSITIYVLYKEK